MNSPEKKFESKDISITLTTGFRESRTAGYEACFEASDMTVYVIKEDYANLTEDQINLSVLDYANLVRANNISKNPSKVSDKNNLVYFEYSYQNEIDGITYKTFSSMYKTANAFWTVQFCCEDAIYADYTTYIQTWAQSVFFTLKDMDYTVDELQITLAEGFNATDLSEFNTANRIINREEQGEQYVAIYRSFNNDAIINFKREDYSLSPCPDFATYYTEVHQKYSDLYDINKLENCSDLTVDNNLVFFEIERKTPINPITGKSTETRMSYFVACYTGNNAFWTLEFACATANYKNYKDSFMGWAKSIQFVQPQVQ